MKKAIRTTLLFSITLTSLFFTSQTIAQAVTDDAEVGGTITFDPTKQELGIQDPENPEVKVDPGAYPSTKGNLRIDFVPQLIFGNQEIVNKNLILPVNAQLFKDETTPRGEFIQVSDYRGAALGWTLQVRQETQFKSETTNSQLNGAVLSFDESWTNSTRDKSQAPTVSKEVVRLNNIGQTYNLAEADLEHGNGTWSITFGASSENKDNKKSTLKPKVDEQGKPVTDSAYGNKQVHTNSAINLSIPKGTEIQPGNYTTVLTWILAELP